MRLGELSDRLGVSLAGDREIEIRGVAALDRAGPGELSFLSNPKYRHLLRTTRASAVIARLQDQAEGIATLVAANPYLAFAQAVTLLYPERHPQRGVEVGAWVHPSARLGAHVTAMAGCYVDEDVAVGEGTVIYPGVYLGRQARTGRDCLLHANSVVREGCVLGDRVILQPGCVVGSDGYGYAQDGARHVKIHQVGIVVLEDDVEVGAGTTIDRAAMGETRIGRGTKIDNLVQIAHNVQIGQDCLIIAQVGISGSTQIGDRVVLAGQVGLVGHIRLGDGVMVGAQSGVNHDLPAGTMVTGSPAIDHREWLKIQAVIRRLPQLRQKIQNLERKLKDLEGGLSAPGPRPEAEEGA
jgi:UDP-3-O-[3-hydroxymyristoyl] glucosamine N-acyltransferase